MIPLTIQLDRVTFERLERLATREGRNPRDLVVAQLRNNLGTRPIRVGMTVERRKRDVDEWMRLARAGATNNAIAAQFGVSKSLVSNELRARGLWRNRRKSI